MDVNVLKQFLLFASSFSYPKKVINFYFPTITEFFFLIYACIVPFQVFGRECFYLRNGCAQLCDRRFDLLLPVSIGPFVTLYSRNAAR